jgi:hypothetical protein
VELEGARQSTVDRDIIRKERRNIVVKTTYFLMPVLQSTSVAEPEPHEPKLLTAAGAVMMSRLWLQSGMGISCYKLKLSSTRAFLTIKYAE